MASFLKKQHHVVDAFGINQSAYLKTAADMVKMAETRGTATDISKEFTEDDFIYRQ